MAALTFTTDSPDETFTLAKALGEVLVDRDFVGLSGQLGAGKTLFARGLATGAGVDVEDVSSPTYSIVQSYRGRVTLHHADLYRLQTEADLYATGYFDLLESEGAWLVEWVEQVPSAAPEDSLRISVGVELPNRRTFLVSTSGPTSQALLERWQACLQRSRN